MDIKEVATRADLEKFLRYCENAGFRFGSSLSEVVDNKIQSIIWTANTLNVEYDSKKLKREFFDPTENFNDFAVHIANHFSHFSPDDKIQEVVNKYVRLDALWIQGGNHEKNWNDWLAKGFAPVSQFEKIPYAFGVYDFSKPATKTKFRFFDSSFGINQVLTALGASWECPYFYGYGDKRAPDNENIKTFKNGNCLILDNAIATKLVEFLKNKYTTKNDPYTDTRGLFKF
mgnify:CR=1 FL=1